jgi:hypothetical protein
MLPARSSQLLRLEGKLGKAAERSVREREGAICGARNNPVIKQRAFSCFPAGS